MPKLYSRIGSLVSTNIFIYVVPFFMLESPLPSFGFDPKSDIPLYRQIYNAVRQNIMNGALPFNSKLPATRAFSVTYGVSRNTVLAAFDDLIAEGFLEARVGAGTFVKHKTQVNARVTKQQLSNRGLAISSTTFTIPRETQITAFRHGIGDLKLFPWDVWTRLYKRAAHQNQNFGYPDPAGFLPLRQAIASHIAATRAVHCSSDQIIITSGSQQAIVLAAQLLLEPNDLVWHENPGYLGARGALLAVGAQVVPVPVDEFGLDVLAGKHLAPKARLAYVTPSHQYPTGVTMSHERRLQLLKWANTANAWILEDDYDSEYRYDHRPLESLQSLDQHGRVIYIGTFSKVLFPALRLGYMVVPANLVAAFTTARALQDRGSSLLEQYALADFMAELHFARHVRRTQKLYLERQIILRDQLGLWLPDLELQGFEAGIHLCAWLPKGLNDLNISRSAAQHGLEAMPISAYSQTPLARGGLFLGYAAVPSSSLRDGVRTLAQIVLSKV
jgi:GntR family transcriptional regulator / MocR family aminotransferase